jgi:hypothetical protein
MRNYKLFYGFALVFLAGVILYLGSAVSRSSFFNNESHGNAVLQDSLSIAGVSQLSSDCNCDIEIIPSDNERVVFYYDKKLFENLTEVNGSNLNINFKSIKHFVFGFNSGNGGDVTVKVYTNKLNSITQDGIGSIESSGILNADEMKIVNGGVGSMEMNVNANKLTVENSGVGSIDIKGKANHAEMNNNGTGSIDGIDLINKFAKVDNSGVGSIDVNATDSLDMSNTGVGGITYTGGAVITSINSEGVGTISKQ